MNNVSTAIEKLKLGEMIIVTDHQSRENEGDLVLAAQFANTQNINFMATKGKGLICAPLSSRIAKNLGLPLMIKENECTHKTAFTVSVDARKNVTTGISASDRAQTLSQLAQGSSTADDFSRPGHIFPLIAKDEGLKSRQGHTEATIDLLRLAKLKEVGVICEIMNDQGEMMRAQELENFSKDHNISMVSIDEIMDFQKSL